MTGAQSARRTPLAAASTEPRFRRRYGIAAACTLTVTILFVTIGDGVDVPEATGLRHLVITFGHTLVLGLLTVAFLIAAIRQRWNRTSQAVAVVAALAGVVGDCRRDHCGCNQGSAALVYLWR